ncbi:MAG TPA: substrate-binding domain-containing protein [Stellaceae bacterium]
MRRVAAAAVLAIAATLAVPAIAAAPAPGAADGAERVLRVCADPNNLPFSNARGEGFENKIATLLARDLGAGLDYTWWAQRRGFVRNTLRAGDCDVLPGVPKGYELALTSKPYYRSTYVFVVRRDSGLRLASLDDPALRKTRIGVQMIGDDFANTPPAHALSKRGIIDNIVGYTVYGDYAQPNPAGRIVGAVAAGEVDVALVWGPFAGYFAPRQSVALAVEPIAAESDGPGIPFVFDIAMGVRKGDTALRDEIDAFLTRRKSEIEAILTSYGVPLLPAKASSP